MSAIADPDKAKEVGHSIMISTMASNIVVSVGAILKMGADA